MFRTSNPAFRKHDEFRPAQKWDDVAVLQPAAGFPSAPGREKAVARIKKADHMTIGGTVTKTFLLLAMCVATAIFGWNVAMSGESWAWMLMLGGGIGGLIIGLICSFVPRSAPITAPLFALAEGLFVGGISAVYAQMFAVPPQDGGAISPNVGLVFNAVLLTFGILGGLLTAYSVGLIRPGPLFKRIVITATFGVCIYGVVALVASLFGAGSLASVYDPSNGGLLSIGFSLLVVGIASANLVLDFDFIENGAANKAPKYMEWYGGFGLLVTLIWLYLEVLRLLSKLQSRD